MSFTARGSPSPLRLEVPAEAAQLHELRDALDQWLRTAGIPDERCERIALAMNEAVTNSIVHGYRDGAVGSVHVAVDHLSDGTIVLTVSDHGTWRLPLPGRDSGGRGVLMMQECADDVRIDSSAAGTTVTITVKPHALPEPVAHSQARHSVGVRKDGEEVVARVTGDLTGVDAVLLRRQLLAATCGGVVPLRIDLSGLETVPHRAKQAIKEAARAADGVGGRVRVVAPDTQPTSGRRPAE